MYLAKRIFAVMCIIAAVSGCLGKVSIEKRIDGLLAKEFADKVQEFIDTNHAFKLRANAATENLAGMKKKMSAAKFEQMMYDVSLHERKMEELNQGLSSIKSYITFGILEVLKEEGYIKEVENQDAANLINQRLLIILENKTTRKN